MQFGPLFVAAVASTAVQAVLELTDSTFAGITVGEPFDITWKGATGDVTLILLDDANPNDAKPIATITSGLTGTSFAWTPSPTLVNLADYAIKIVDSVTSNFGAQFQLIGATASPTATTGSSSVSATTTTETTASTTATSSTETTTAQSTTSGSTITLSATSSTSTYYSNTTTTTSQKSTASHTSATTTGPSGSQTSAPSAANSIASPLALILLTVAALISLN